MSPNRNRPLLIAAAAIILVWLLAWSGYVISKHSKMTSEKVSHYQRSLDLARLSSADRLKALKKLAGQKSQSTQTVDKSQLVRVATHHVLDQYAETFKERARYDRTGKASN